MLDHAGAYVLIEIRKGKRACRGPRKVLYLCKRADHASFENGTSVNRLDEPEYLVVKR